MEKEPKFLNLPLKQPLVKHIPVIYPRRKSYFAPIAGLVILVLTGTYLYFFSFLGADYSPYYGDEFFYFKNSESFLLHSNLRAAFSYGGIGSRIFGIDPHGPAYPLLYGLISKLIGWHSLNIPVINFCIFLFASVSLFFWGKNDRKSSLRQIVLVVGSPITLFYSITFLPELIHLAGGVLLYIACEKHLRDRSPGSFSLLLFLILVLGFFRTTWFFALFGLILLPGPLRGLQKTILGLSAFILPFLLQHFFHEQVPNTFSEFTDLLSKGNHREAIAIVLFNMKRNLYFAFTYTEGWFYSLQKIWMVGSLVLALLFFKKNPLLQFGLITIGVVIVFNMVLYKNYTWVDLRLYTPLLFYLNLGLIAKANSRNYANLLIGMNLVSFALILPLQYEMITYRIAPDVIEIPGDVRENLSNLESEFILLDSAVLNDFALDQLPISSKRGLPIRYILPYYPMPQVRAAYDLKVENGQLKVSPRNILSQ